MDLDPGRTEKHSEGGNSTTVQYSSTPSTLSNVINATEEKKIQSDQESVKLTKSQKMLARAQFVALCWNLFVIGWNDGTIGPLLPRIQEVYRVNFAIVSLLFVFACVGFLSGALLNIYVTDKFPFGKIIVFGSLCQIIAYAIKSSAPPFPVLALGYVINGVGVALEDAQANGFVASLSKNAEAKMGILHAAYGLGAFSAPLVSTQFATLPRWSFHFLVSLGLAISNAVFLSLVFKLKSQAECLTGAGEVIPERTASQDESSFRTVLRTKAVHLLAFFILVYVGVEVTIGGWIVTFIIDVRGGGPSSGYISSGFFGGLTLGRVILLPINKAVGEHRVIFIYGIIALGLEFVIWFVPSIVGNAVAVSIVGVILGPMYPIVMNQTSRVLPRWILTSSIGWIAGFGQAGSALLPFMTGAIAEKHGIKSLEPLLVGMMVFMLFLWALVPSKPRSD